MHHLIVSATYGSEGDTIPSSEFGAAFEEVIRRNGVEPVSCVSYTSHYALNPVDCGLKDAWIGLTANQRQAISQYAPELHRAIFLMLTGSDPQDAPGIDDSTRWKGLNNGKH